MELKIKNKLAIDGVVKVQLHNPSIIGMDNKFFDRVMVTEYEKARHNPGALQRLDDWAARCLVEDGTYHNVTCTVARTQIRKSLGNDTPTATYLEYCAVGTNAAAPTVADTILGTELARKQITLLTQASTQIIARTFFLTSEANGVLKEVGHFLDDATAAANSGTIFDHVAINQTKTSSLTLTIICTIAISDGT